ncbi:MAG: MFS transporter [Thermaerobacter sp.]|nr:MFS transporter [Thermaerobacter sp.]
MPGNQPLVSASPHSRAPLRAMELSGRALWLSFAAATTGTFMVNVDASVVNVALPVLQKTFMMPIATLQWIVTAYLLVITGTLPVAGRLADWLGRREVFLAGIAVFVLGSVACAVSPDFSALVAARIFQGFGGAIIMANVMAIIALIFPPEQRGKALGLIGSVVAAGTLAGPPLGGLLTATYGWRSIFWINLPVGIWGLLGSWRYLPRFARDRAFHLRTLDWPGALLFMLATSLFQFSLVNLHRPAGWVLLILTGLAVYGFVRVEKTVALPLIPLRLFRIRAFSLNMISGLAYWVLMMFPAFLLPFYLKEELHLPIGLIGLSLVPQALAMIVVSPWGGRMSDRYGVLVPGRIALGLFIVADVLFAVLPATPPLWQVWALLLVIGTAAGLFSSPQNAAVLNAVAKPDTGLASSLLATQRNLGRAMGVAFASIILSLVWMAHGLGATPSHSNSQYALWFLWGFRGVFWSGVGFAVVGLATLAQPPAAAPKGPRIDSQKQIAISDQGAEGS